MESILHVHNIKCSGCANSIKQRLEKLDDVAIKEVNVEDGKIIVETPSAELLSEVRSTLSKMGYPESDPSILQNAKSYFSCMIGRMSDGEKS